MRKILLATFMLLGVLAMLPVHAQSREVTGTVTSGDDGSPIPGVNITIKGTTQGASTNAQGVYRISVPNRAVLVFSSIGFAKQEIESGDKSVIDVILSTGNAQLSEVVVTGAYGTKQSARSATYSAQVVSQEQLNVIRQSNFNNALAGKVAGIQVRSQSAAALGRNTEVRLRGTSGFGTGSGALYVVDGTILPNIDDINNDDIENVSVLQGPAAAAQFGSQAANGAIVITMKKGRKTPGLGVTLNLGAQFDKVYILPNYQNSYAGGSSSDLMRYNWKEGDPVEWKALDGKYYHDYNDDSSWGPRMVGQEYIPWYSWYGGHSRSYQTARLTPQPNNGRDFYETGVFLNNSVTLNTASDQLNFKLTYGNQYTNGLLPNSDLKKNTLNIATTYELNKHFEASANINYSNWVLNGQIDDAYGNQSTGAFNQWFHRDLDIDIMRELRGLKTPDGVYGSWNHSNPISYDPSNPKGFYGANYWYNTYTFFDLYKPTQQRDRLFGDVSFTYKANDDLRFKFTYRKQQTTTFYETKISSQLESSANQTGVRGYYATGNTFSNRRNLEFIALYNKKFSDVFSIDANVGADLFKWVSKSNSSNTNQGLSIPDLFTISNSVNAASIGNGRVTEAYNAIFGKAVLGFRNLLFVEATLRNDWFSTLPANDNSVLSQSFGASFVFSDLLPKSSTSWLTSGKVRASWGQIPKALGTTNETFGAYRYPGMAYGVNQFKWGSNFLMGTPDQIVSPNIKGSVASQKEIGLDLEFFNSRLGLSATYWDGSEVGFPYSLTINGASGFSSLLTNIGKITKQGIELKVTARPVSLANFRWDITATYADLIKNDVVELSREYGVTRTNNLGGVWGSTVPYLVHEEGKRWGQLYGNGIKRINGQPVVNSNGFYVNDPNVHFGSVLPRITGGLQNGFTILNDFILNVNIDYQIGGKFASLSNMWGSYSGLTARTATVNDKGNPIRDAVADGGGIRVSGVNESGEAVSNYVEARDYYANLYNNRTFDEFIYDLTFVKLREASIGYRLPVRKLGIDKYVKDVTFSIVARNPVLIYAKTKDFDPSEVSAVYGETGQLPGTRGLGFNLRLGF